MSSKISALIADDESLARINVREGLRPFPRWTVASEVERGDRVMPSIIAHRPDVVFLDIHMPGQSGVEIARALAAQSPGPLVVFVTAFDQYAVEAFELCAFDYLLKPFDDERLRRLVHRVERSLDSTPRGDLEQLADHLQQPTLRLNRLLIRSIGAIKVLPIDDVLWFSASGNYVEVHHRDGHDLHRVQLSTLERKLDPAEFCRVHRSAIVRVRETRQILFRDGNVIVAIMSNGAEVRVSARYREVLIAALDR